MRWLCSIWCSVATGVLCVVGTPHPVCCANHLPLKGKAERAAQCRPYMGVGRQEWRPYGGKRGNQSVGTAFMLSGFENDGRNKNSPRWNQWRGELIAGSAAANGVERPALSAAASGVERPAFRAAASGTRSYREPSGMGSITFLYSRRNRISVVISEAISAMGKDSHTSQSVPVFRPRRASR